MNRMFSEPHCIFLQIVLIRKLSIACITNNVDEFYHDTDHFIKFTKIVQYFSWVNIFTVEELSVRTLLLDVLVEQLSALQVFLRACQLLT